MTRLQTQLAAIALTLFASQTLVAQPGNVSFNFDIKPLLADRCFVCHGPDAGQRQADLRLDQRPSAMRESESANAPYVIKPGSPAESELILRVTTDDNSLKMPPADSNLQLSKDEIELLRRWVEQGADWQDHWSFIPLEEVSVPEVADSNWPRNEIDRFVLHRLRDAELEPSREATRERLIRRLSFDLTGLPPSLAEIDAFLADDSPDAYELAVDRLLDSERYGERMAAVWLDVARYSDTFGYQVDRDRFVWPWRDWVIRAFNANMPYDQFVTEQLAGDLLPNATDDQVLATAFNRLHPQKVEGGSTPEEFRIEYVADRNQTFATAILGLTLECARCHDHKYDPVTQREYYQLTAFFDNIDEAGLYSYFTPSVPTPTLLLTSDDAKRKLADVEQEIAEAEAALASLPEQRRSAFDEWVASQPTEEARSIPGRIAHLKFEEQLNGPNVSVPGVVGQGVELSGDDGIGVGFGNFTRFQPFSVALWMNTPDEKERAVVFHRSRAWTDAASRGYQLLIEEGRLSASLIHFWPGNAIRVRTNEKISNDQWLHVAITYDGSSRADGLQIFVDGELAKSEVVRDNLYKNITGGGGDNITIGQRFRDRGFAGGRVDEFQVFDRELTPIEVGSLHAGEAIDVGDREGLYAYYLATADEQYQALLARLRELREARSKLVDGVQEIMVMRELSTPRQTYFLNRGAYDARGEPVPATTPAILSAFPEGAPQNRLGLARWVTDPKNPLTARVAVNRFWQMLMGDGLVRTPEDFGSQGQLPTHPLLLDWLARDFLEHDWNIKRLLKQIVMSATYRQSSAVSAEQVAKDPENRLLGRSPSYRWSAEMLRDNALATSGLLVNRIGGAPAKPYEVEVSFKPAKRDSGDGLYRRSVYTYWKRTGPAPVMMALDAAKRDVCRVKRERTSSPLQALVMMNGVQFVEAARVLAQRQLTVHGDDHRAALHDVFRLLTSTAPTDSQLSVLVELYESQLTRFTARPESASEYLQTGDRAADAELDPLRLAALASVANALFSYDECMTKR